MESYSLGAIGTGHWFNRLYLSAKSDNRISIRKAAGTSPFEDKRERLSAIGLQPSSYYQVTPGMEIPKDFFSGLDAVHISNPNEFHARQTLQSIGEGKVTVTEKTWGIDKEEFMRVSDEIKSSGAEKRTYLHLHYAHKLLTMELSSLLDRFAKENGRISSMKATFFERTKEDDIRRKRWLFSPKNGGLFMDWIHPFEIIYLGAGSSRMKLKSVDTYIVNQSYDTENPTGIDAEVEVSGNRFSPNATAKLSLAKGTEKDTKSFVFTFESGASLKLDYMDSETEFSSGKRGRWSFRSPGNEIKGEPSGPSTSELLINDIVSMLEGRQAGISLKDLEEIFSPQWDYQEISKRIRPSAETWKVKNFMQHGTEL